MAKLMSNEDGHVSKKSANTKLKPDFTKEEAMFLRALLIDDPLETKDESGRSEKSAKVLDDEILFSLPFTQEKKTAKEEEPTEQPKTRRRYRPFLLGLWKAYEDGVKPRVLIRKASSLAAQKDAQEDEGDGDDDDDESIESDVEVRGETQKDDQSSCSSWGEEDGGQEHYDAWEVLKDEYAEDFGFDYDPRSFEDDYADDQAHVFKILGTSATDESSYPHVLSPPLMDSLMAFLPESLENQNFWLKYSLVRDGASMQTLKNYVRASHNTLLAIETTSGEVFGAFTRSPWRTQFGKLLNPPFSCLV